VHARMDKLFGAGKGNAGGFGRSRAGTAYAAGGLHAKTPRTLQIRLPTDGEDAEDDEADEFAKRVASVRGLRKNTLAQSIHQPRRPSYAPATARARPRASQHGFSRQFSRQDSRASLSRPSESSQGMAAAMQLLSPFNAGRPSLRQRKRPEAGPGFRYSLASSSIEPPSM